MTVGGGENGGSNRARKLLPHNGSASDWEYNNDD